MDRQTNKKKSTNGNEILDGWIKINLIDGSKDGLMDKQTDKDRQTDIEKKN